MKIYVSEKDQNKYVYYYGGGRESIECKSTTEPMVVSSLEQHEKEIRKPLEDEIKELKYKLGQVQELSNQLLSDAYLTDVWKTQEIKNLKQEHLKVIAELEEWVDGYDWWMQDGVIYIVRKDLRQKLKEMKEVRDEN